MGRHRRYERGIGTSCIAVARSSAAKNKPSYTPHVDCGDYVIVINADKVKLTGKKMTDKVYTRHTGFPGGQRFATPADYLAKKPTFLIEKAVKGMLPKRALAKHYEESEGVCRRRASARRSEPEGN